MHTPHVHMSENDSLTNREEDALVQAVHSSAVHPEFICHQFKSDRQKHCPTSHHRGKSVCRCLCAVHGKALPFAVSLVLSSSLLLLEIYVQLKYYFNTNTCNKHMQQTHARRKGVSLMLGGGHVLCDR